VFRLVGGYTESSMYRKGKGGFKGLRIEGTRGRGWRA